MDGPRTRAGFGGLRKKLSRGVVDVAAHALLLGEDWRRVLDMDRGELDELVESAVWERASEMRFERDERLAVMIGNELAKRLSGK